MFTERHFQAPSNGQQSSLVKDLAISALIADTCPALLRTALLPCRELP